MPTTMHAPDPQKAALIDLVGRSAAEESLGNQLARVTRLAVAAGACDVAGVMLIGTGTAHMAAGSDPGVALLYQVEYAADAGPCLDAARARRVNVLPSTRAETPWPEFSAQARRIGVASLMAVPLVVDDESIGAFSFYSNHDNAFPDAPDAAAGLIAAQAAATVANARLITAARAQAAQLEGALGSRSVIEQAKGIVMATLHCSSDEAFEQLRVRSQSENRKLRQIAQEVVDAVAAPS